MIGIIAYSLSEVYDTCIAKEVRSMFVEDITAVTKQNTHFRQVLHTGQYSQIVAMNILTGQEIGAEIHATVDQILVIVEGEGQAIINKESKKIVKHDVIFVPAGAMHNIKNTGEEDLKLFTVYSPPEHKDGTVHHTKEDALLAEKEE